MSDTWQIPVVVFHHVSPTIDYYTNVLPELFRAQIELLAKTYRFWTVSEAYKAFSAGVDPQGRIVLTFDDGYEDNFLFARPVLAEHGIRATFFVLPMYAGRENTWNTRAQYRTRHMSWDQIQTLAAEGHEIGSHGLHHRPLTEMDYDGIEAELVTSWRWLADALSAPITSFSYPYGLANPAVSELTQKYYQVAFSTVKSDEADWRRGTHRLRRIYIPEHIELSELVRYITYGGPT